MSPMRHVIVNVSLSVSRFCKGIVKGIVRVGCLVLFVLSSLSTSANYTGYTGYQHTQQNGNQATRHK